MDGFTDQKQNSIENKLNFYFFFFIGESAKGKEPQGGGGYTVQRPQYIIGLRKFFF